jgi:outer membrane protein OmpA-like peptidoglycan-associated protein
MSKTLKTLTLIAVIAAIAPACASRGFVRTEVGAVGQDVETLAATGEETRERTRQNEERIEEVDRRAGAAVREAQSSADAAAMAALDVDERVTAVAEETQRLRRLIFEVTLNEQQANFSSSQAELPDEARTLLDQLVIQLQEIPESVYLEIEGHTDSTGSETLNMQLGMERAEAVRLYLYETHSVPLHRMNVISYGESVPVAPNETAEGRAQNRRVVIRVLS